MTTLAKIIMDPSLLGIPIELSKSATTFELRDDILYDLLQFHRSRCRPHIYKRAILMNHQIIQPQTSC